MKKRLRKKRQIGEFAEYGFQVDIELADHEASQGFFLDFIDFAERHGLLAGGGGGKVMSYFVTHCAVDHRGWTDRHGRWHFESGRPDLRRCRSGMSEAHRGLVEAYVSARLDVKRQVVGPLVDENKYEWPDEPFHEEVECSR